VRSIGYSGDAILTADGCITGTGEITQEGCCPIEPCNIDPCSLMCNFVQLLPNGPLWDRAKQERMVRYSQEPCGPACLPEISDCASVVDYAIYTGYQMNELIKGPLWSALREADPETAVETLDSWLQMYGWNDSWESLCRDKRLGPSPFECGVTDPPLDACDASFSPIYVPPIPAALDSAVKRGIVLALRRLQMSPIKSLCGINWIIEPLGAYLRPSDSSANECCTGMVWQLCSLSDTIEETPPKHCVQERAPRRIQAWFPMDRLSFNPTTGSCEPTGPGTVRIWPGILAAQIIALSLMPTRDCGVPIYRCLELGDMPVVVAGNFVTQQYEQNGVAVPAATAWTLNRATSALYFNAAGNYVAAGVDVARFDHDPTNSNMPLGMLLEPVRTNYVRQAYNLNVAPWMAGSGVGAVVAAAGDPSVFSGNLWKLTRVTGGDWRQQNVVAANTRTTVSVAVKRSADPTQPLAAFQYHITGGTGTAILAITYNFDTDELASSGNPRVDLIDAKRTIYPNGEVLLSITGLPNNGGTLGYVLLAGGIPGTTLGDMGQYGAVQLEYSSANANDTTRIGSGAVAATRARDELTLRATGENDWTLFMSDGTTRYYPGIVGDLFLTAGMLGQSRHILSYVAV
jgi:hypothetical protein